MHRGSCLCGAVQIAVTGALPMPVACHCITCRKQTGHYEVSTDIPRTALSVSAEENVRWYHSSKNVRRGFCETCGSTLFWDPIDQDWTAVAMGAFDGLTGTSITAHIFISEKGDYYELEDDVPQSPGVPARSKS